jgi:DnaJ domain
MADDPYTVLGVSADASMAELTAARRRLAMTMHPDVGGDAAAMQALNRAFDDAVRRLSASRSAPTSAPAAEPPPSPTSPPTRRRSHLHGVQYDSPSFTIDVLPVEAFEALLVVTSWMGEALVDDPPYLLEAFLHDPAPCWCRLDLVPDAGGTTVSLTVAGVDGALTPDPELVRDEWVANLNRLGDLPD